MLKRYKTRQFIVSFGSGKLPQSGSDDSREAFGQIPELKYADIFDFGANFLYFA